MNLTVKDFIKNGSVCEFLYLRAGFAFYTIDLFLETDESIPDSCITYCFPIPLEDLNGATISCKEKPITLMRYIRKAIENNEMVVYSQTISNN